MPGVYRLWVHARHTLAALASVKGFPLTLLGFTRSVKSAHSSGVLPVTWLMTSAVSWARRYGLASKTSKASLATRAAMRSAWFLPTTLRGESGDGNIGA